MKLFCGDNANDKRCSNDTLLCSNDNGEEKKGYNVDDKMYSNVDDKKCYDKTCSKADDTARSNNKADETARLWDDYANDDKCWNDDADDCYNKKCSNADDNASIYVSRSGYCT